MTRRGLRLAGFGLALLGISAPAGAARPVVAVFDLESKGAKRLPNPPIELPDWLEDTRDGKA